MPSHPGPSVAWPGATTAGPPAAARAGAPVAWPTRVLIVDDQASTRFFLRAVLEDHGRYDIVGEADGADRAVELADMLQPDLVLLDVGMPAGDGTGALDRILAIAPRAKVVILSGMNPRIVEPLLDAGASAFVPKGVAPVELLERIDATLDRPGPGPGPTPPADRPGPAATRPAPPAPPAPRPRVTAIVCDDDPVARRLVSRVLDTCGVEVAAETETVPNLLSVVGLAQPTLVVLDLWLEGTPGTAALPEIRQLSNGTSVVVFSGFEEWKDRALAAGAAAFVPKPRFDELETCIQRLTGVRA